MTVGRRMTEEDAIGIATRYVDARGSGLMPEISAWRRKRFFSRRPYWRVVSNVSRKGGNWLIEVDESSAAVVKAHFTKK